MEDGMSFHSPPHLASWLLSRCLTARDRDEVLGDLAEEFSLRIQSSDSGWSWYWGQALRSIPSVVWKYARRAGWIRTFFVALGAYIGAGVVESAADAALSTILTPAPPLHTILSLIIGLVTIAAGGYVASRFRPGAETALSVIVFMAANEMGAMSAATPVASARVSLSAARA